jgi:hypothetical protein
MGAGYRVKGAEHDDFIILTRFAFCRRERGGHGWVRGHGLLDF